MSTITDRLSAPKALRLSAHHAGQVNGWPIRLFSTIAAIPALLLREWRITRDLRNLSQMSDAMLQDIGVSRGSLEAVVRYGRHAGVDEATPGAYAVSRLPPSAATDWR
jgi:uncharacterized protein YjiS (DUF1127 family)